MTEKRFSTNGYYIYDHFHDGERWLVNEVEAEEIVDRMNNLDTKARENSKALSTLQKKLNELAEENQQLKNDCSILVQSNQDYRKENEQLKQLLDYADDLIQSHLSEHFIRQWRNFKTGHKEYNEFWEEKIKKHNELKESVE